jgi:hypothetical protein
MEEEEAERMCIKEEEEEAERTRCLECLAHAVYAVAACYV